MLAQLPHPNLLLRDKLLPNVISLKTEISPVNIVLWKTDMLEPSLPASLTLNPEPKFRKSNKLALDPNRVTERNDTEEPSETWSKMDNSPEKLALLQTDRPDPIRTNARME
jgi:hypothetical protein